jgi:hypothetical protein
MTDTKLLYKNKAFRGVYLNGRKARFWGFKRLCPYKDLRTFSGQAAHKKQTFSRGFIAAWLRGYDDETREPSSAEEGSLL